MPFTLIKGKFQVVGYQPDGDSLRFEVKNPKIWNKLTGRMVKLTKGRAQLRFEGIDALETHYKGWHQPEKLAHKARDFLLRQAGFENVIWGPKKNKVTSVKKDGLPGYVFARTIEKYGRPVCFVFAGKRKGRTGQKLHLSVAELKKSLNYKLLAAGVAYPIYYDTLFYDFRNAMTLTVKRARKNEGDIWKEDKTSGVEVKNRTSIEDKYHFFPKLFRRMVEYMKTHNNSIAGFLDYDSLKKEQVIILSKGHKTHFDNVLYMKGKKVGLKYKPEDLIFIMVP